MYKVWVDNFGHVIMLQEGNLDNLEATHIYKWGMGGWGGIWAGRYFAAQARSPRNTGQAL